MLVICDRVPEENALYIRKHTNKSYLFKSLLELAQLICSCGISKVYKPIKQGKELQEWILKNKLWTYRYYRALLLLCLIDVDLKPKTAVDLKKIEYDLAESVEKKKRIVYPKAAIFRYKKGYESKYLTNSELPFEECIKEYKEYLKWKNDTRKDRRKENEGSIITEY